MTYTTDTAYFHNNDIEKVCERIDEITRSIKKTCVYNALSTIAVKNEVKDLLESLVDKRNMLQALCADFDLEKNRQLTANILACTLYISNTLSYRLVGEARTEGFQNDETCRNMKFAMGRVRALWYAVMYTNLGEVAEELINEQLTEEDEED